MNLYINEQAAAMGLAALLGAALGLIYDLLRILRRRVRLRAVTAVCDLVFWITAAASFFMFTMAVTGGVLRLYALFGVACGMTLWLLTLSPLLLALGDAICSGVAAILRLIFTPFRIIYKHVVKCCKKLYLFTKKLFPKRKKKCMIDVSSSGGAAS